MHCDKMKNIYKGIVEATLENRKLLAVLIDPEKIAIPQLPSFLKKSICL